MSLNETMNRLRVERQVCSQPKTEEEMPIRDEPMALTDDMPTIRDLATALYKLKQQPSCHNCLRRELGNCPSRNPMPKQCISFQLNSKQMQTYGEQARNTIKAWREAIAIHAARQAYKAEREFMGIIRKFPNNPPFPKQ